MKTLDFMYLNLMQDGLMEVKCNHTMAELIVMS